MPIVSIVYHSGFGHTAKVAARVAAGARGVDATAVHLLAIEGAQIKDGRWQDETILAQLSASDAIIFGSPTYMGMVSGPFKCFADATAPFWFDQSWKDKLAGGFTSSGYPSGDKISTLHYMVTLAAQLRMIWVGPGENPSNITGDSRQIDRWGFYLGVGVVGNMQDPNTLDEGDLLTAELYGRRLALAAARWTASGIIDHEKLLTPDAKTKG